MLDQLIEDNPEYIALIRYHVWWPSSGDPFYQYNIDENTWRNNYYSNSYTPHLFVNGSIDAGYDTGRWASIFQNASNVESDWEISPSGMYNEDNDSVYLHIEIMLDGENPEGTEFIRCALVENDLMYAGSFHDQTFRHFIPDRYGDYVEPDDQGFFSIDFEFQMPEELINENCEFVFFIQSHLKDIYQSAKLPFDQLGEYTSVEDDSEQIPNRFAMIGNYPNPFNASTVIEFNLAERGNVSLDIYNLSGQKIANVFDGVLNAGKHSRVFNAEDFSSGVYFYKLTQDGQSAVKRMVLLK